MFVHGEVLRDLPHSIVIHVENHSPFCVRVSRDNRAGDFVVGTDSLPRGELTVEVQVDGGGHISEGLGVLRLPIDRYRDVLFEHTLPHWYPVRLDQPKAKAEVCLKLGSIPSPEESRPDSDDWNKVVQVARENNVILERTVRVARETAKLGAEGAAELARQRETEVEVEKDLEGIDFDVAEADQAARRIESCWVMFCGRRKTRRSEHIRDKARRKAQKEMERAERRKTRRKRPDHRRVELRSDERASDSSNLKSLIATPDDRNAGLVRQELEKTERGLDELHRIVGELDSLARELKETLDEEIQTAERLDSKTASTSGHVQRTHCRVRRLNDST
jgi:hypothetical protein